MQVDSQLTVDAIMQGVQKDAQGQHRLLVVGQPTYTVADAQKLFLRKDFHHLPIVASDSDRTVIGIVSVSDIMRCYASDATGDPTKVTLDTVMTKDPKTITPETEVARAVSILARSPFQSLPVVDAQGRAVGIVTTRDIVRFLDANYEEEVFQAVLEASRGRSAEEVRSSAAATKDGG